MNKTCSTHGVMSKNIKTVTFETLVWHFMQKTLSGSQSKNSSACLQLTISAMSWKTATAKSTKGRDMIQYLLGGTCNAHRNRVWSNWSSSLKPSTGQTFQWLISSLTWMIVIWGRSDVWKFSRYSSRFVNSNHWVVLKDQGTCIVKTIFFHLNLSVHVRV